MVPTAALSDARNTWLVEGENLHLNHAQLGYIGSANFRGVVGVLCLPGTLRETAGMER